MNRNVEEEDHDPLRRLQRQPDMNQVIPFPILRQDRHPVRDVLPNRSRKEVFLG